MNAVLDRIRTRLAATGMSESAAARAATGSPDTIRNYRRDVKAGKDRSFNTGNLQALARVLQTTEQWLLTGEGAETASETVRITRVPLLSWVSAGALSMPDYDHQIDAARTVPMANLETGDWIALEVKGDSMDRIAPDGSVILVNRRQRALQSGGFYVFATDGGEASFKRYRTDPQRFEPYSTNAEHEPIFPEGPVRVIGRVRRSILDL